MPLLRSLTLFIALTVICITSPSFASSGSELLGRWTGVINGETWTLQFGAAGKCLLEIGKYGETELVRYKYEVKNTQVIFTDVDGYDEGAFDYALTPQGLSLSEQGDGPIQLTRVEGVKTLPSILQDEDWTIFTVPEVAVRTEITGRFAKTTVNLSVMHNVNNVYEANLQFPLPNNATLTAYALDVGGVMIDSVAVEKARARQVFEQIEDEGIDPSLLEVTSSNELAIEIYPLNKGQSRNIRFTYVETLEADQTGKLIYTFPFDKIGSEAKLDVKVDVLASNSFPELKQFVGKAKQWEKIKHKHFRGYRFTRQRDAQRLEATPPLVLGMKDSGKRIDIVEQDEFGDRYWAAAMDLPLAELAPLENIDRVTLYWDTSLSMAQSDAQYKELLDALLANFQTRPSKTQPAEIEVVKFANAISGSKVFAVDKSLPANIKQYIGSTVYDGSTNFYPVFTALATSHSSYSIIFSDFKPQFFDGEFQPPARAVYAITTAAPANHSLANRISTTSRGLSLNTKLLPTAEIAASIGKRPPKVTVNFEGKGGSWKADSFIQWNIENKLKLRIAAHVPAIANKVGVSIGEGRVKTFKLNKQPYKEAGVAKFLWLNAKVDELNAEGVAAKQRIIDLGVRHKLATPYTSLLVLEQLDQYVQYAIRPPAQIEDADKYDEYRAEMDDETVAQQDIVSALEREWRERVTRWERQERKTQKDVQEWLNKKAQKKESAALAGDAELEEVVVSGMRASLQTAEDISREGDLGDLSVVLSQWQPNAPYYAALKNAPNTEARYNQYLQWRSEYIASFNFYMDAAQIFIQHNEVAQARVILGNVIELGEGDDEAISLAAFNFLQLNDFDTAIFLFNEVIQLQPYEPSAHLNLAKAQSAKASSSKLQADYQAALNTYVHVALGPWDENEPLRILALEALNRLLNTTDATLDIGELPKTLLGHLPMEIRLSLGWNSRTADVDLWVEEPTGERVGYSNKQGFSGGAISTDITDGYGPEVYSARYALEGEYKVYVNLYANASAELTKPVTLTLNVTVYYGYDKERSHTQTLRVEKSGSEIFVGSIKFDPDK